MRSKWVSKWMSAVYQEYLHLLYSFSNSTDVESETYFFLFLTSNGQFISQGLIREAKALAVI